VDDSAEEFFLYEKYLAGTDFQPLPARSVREARDALVRVRPRAIVLDVLLRGEDAWELLVDLKRNDATRNIPVMVVTTLDDEEKARALGADAFWRKPIDRQRLLQRLTQLTAPETIRRILVVDDEEISRYVLRQHLMTPRHVVTEAASGTEALERARLERPDAICLDLAMPDLDGVEVLKRLRADPTTRGIPVLVVTARPLLAGERREVLRKSHGILPKESLSRERALAALEEAFQRAGA
jgi:CheY-like chemotaxis protein